jgi:PEP-CTERM motif
MKISKVVLGAAICAIAVLLFTSPMSANADTYTVYNLGEANFNNVFGIDTAGAVVIFNGNCGDPGASCYTTYVKGIIVGESTTAPSLTYDDGTPCSVPSGFAFAGGTPGLAVCNNGRTGFGSRYNPNGDPAGIYTGPLSDLALVQPFGSTDKLALNGSGDFAWTDGIDEEIFEAVDTTVPEPSTMLLVGSGLISLIGPLRRRLL